MNQGCPHERDAKLEHPDGQETSIQAQENATISRPWLTSQQQQATLQGPQPPPGKSPSAVDVSKVRQNAKRKKGRVSGSPGDTGESASQTERKASGLQNGLSACYSRESKLLNTQVLGGQCPSLQIHNRTSQQFEGVDIQNWGGMRNSIFQPR